MSSKVEGTSNKDKESYLKLCRLLTPDENIIEAAENEKILFSKRKLRGKIGFKDEFGPTLKSFFPFKT
jgi:hypothetical protein